MGKVVKEHKGTQGNNKESLFYDYLVMVFQSLIGITNNWTKYFYWRKILEIIIKHNYPNVLKYK